MIAFNANGNADFTTSIGRWMGLGPYFAMFPMKFAFEVVKEFSDEGGAVLDPFAGRASSIYAAAALQRFGLGIEINPVGWLYGSVKLRPATKGRVLKRVHEIETRSNEIGDDALDVLPEFFKFCYSPRVLRYLLAARRYLNWRYSRVDATLMAILLVYLHGKRESSLSNQMRQGKAMAPDYSVRWWKERDMLPPDVDPVTFLTQRIEWRYAKGRPRLNAGIVVLGDSTKRLRRMKQKVAAGILPGFTLLFTSPPYYDVTNYYYDQWLRLWMLGSDARPSYDDRGTWQKKFASKANYRTLLSKIFSDCADLMTEDAVVYVRTDAREFTLSTTREILHHTFPGKTIEIREQPFRKQTQTALYGDKASKPGEVDLILRP